MAKEDIRLATEIAEEWTKLGNAADQITISIAKIRDRLTELGIAPPTELSVRAVGPALGSIRSLNLASELERISPELAARPEKEDIFGEYTKDCKCSSW